LQIRCKGRGITIAMSVLYGYVIGSNAFALLWVRPAVIAFQRDCGLNLDGRLIPWSYIRSAQWLPDRPQLLNLHRIDGDVLVEVPANVFSDVEAFVSQSVASSGGSSFGQDA
jgi:hypothetical protein